MTLTNVTSPAIEIEPTPTEVFLANVRNVELLCSESEA